MEILTGKKVTVYDNKFNKYRTGIVVCHYGHLSRLMHKIMGGSLEIWRYPNLIDVQFNDRLSKGHFADDINIF